MCDPQTPQEITQKEVVQKAIQSVINEGGGQIHVIFTEQTQQLPQPPAPYNFHGIRHTIQSVPAMATLLQRHGDTVKSVVYFNDKNINAILDQTIMDRPFDTAVYNFEMSPPASDWKNVFGRELGQKDFIKFLKSREPNEVPNFEALMAAAQKITGNFKVVTESSYQDSNNLGIVYRIEDQNGKTLDEGKMMLPEKMIITLPMLNESPHYVGVEVELELTKPVDGRAPFFVLSCPRWTTFWRQAVELAVKDLREALPGYLIIAGAGYQSNN